VLFPQLRLLDAVRFCHLTKKALAIRLLHVWESSHIGPQVAAMATWCLLPNDSIKLILKQLDGTTAVLGISTCREGTGQHTHSSQASLTDSQPCLSHQRTLTTKPYSQGAELCRSSQGWRSTFAVKAGRNRLLTFAGKTSQALAAIIVKP